MRPQVALLFPLRLLTPKRPHKASPSRPRSEMGAFDLAVALLFFLCASDLARTVGGWPNYPGCSRHVIRLLHVIQQCGRVLRLL